ncbi:MAG: FMN-binding glutamate synthase family protein [Candidatus Reconcilbacillus cellulovorans]|uniref:FMN-binding glutamate synthase family protein n=1 Tax=Candidatus Reconcilbacillus cellulovorans TaxID=1906605 RepID=A0A2A6E406_9BACL|nr:MAG: FMN-binding glutamate synthase family protein [Candidatus Reconcilbacillus cellulovorans]
MHAFVWSFFGTIAALAVGAAVVVFSARTVLRRVVGRAVRRVVTDPYKENVAEMLPAFLRMPPHLAIENSLRAETGTLIERPFGSALRLSPWQRLVFSPAQLHPMPIDPTTPVDVSLTVGPYARRPLRLDIPILLGAMGFGVGVSEKLRLALAKGASAAGTAVNTGQGPLLPEERALARKMIVQFHTGHWARFSETFRFADAVEIRLGQGASAGVGVVLPAESIEGTARERMRLPAGQPAVLPSRFPELTCPEDLAHLVEYIRRQTDGVPVGVKCCAGRFLERDLDAALAADVDFICLDGAEGGAKAAVPVLQDDFGLPTMYALCRAVRHLARRGKRDGVTLLVGGGLFTPGECLKAIALGADGVYLGTAALWAMTHVQVAKAVPFEPPTQLVYYNGKLNDQFDVERAAEHLRKFFASFVEEMKVGVRALGKTSLRDLSPDDLMALDEQTARITGVRPAYGGGDSDAESSGCLGNTVPRLVN